MRRLAVTTALAAVTLIMLSTAPAAVADPPPWAVSLAAEESSVTVPESIHLKAEANQSPAGMDARVYIVDDNTGQDVNWSQFSPTVVATPATSWSENEDPKTRRYHAEVRKTSTGAVLATSSQVVVDVKAAQWSATLETSVQEVTVPGSIQVTAEANRSVASTGYKLFIVDDNTDEDINWTTSSHKQTATRSTSWSENQDPKDRRYHAEIRHVASGVVVATSDEVVVDVKAAEWVSTIEADVDSVVIPGAIHLTAEANRAMSGTGYKLFLVDDNKAKDLNWTASAAKQGATASVGWAENPEALARQFHAEVRHTATGAIAAASEPVVVDLIQATFAVTLAIVPNGSSHKATATSTPSVSGTGYALKIRALNGTQICSAASGSVCPVTVSPGTYRATVEHPSGHIAAQSSWWTVSASGVEEEVADDLDLIALAGAFAGPSAVCTELLFYPGTHVASATVTDQYLACEAAVTEGKATLAVLRAVVAAGGGTAVLWYLAEQITEEATEADPSDEEEVEDPTPAPPPIAWPGSIEDDVDLLMLQNPQLTSRTVARTVLKTCHRSVLRAGLTTDDCLNLPIFASGDLDVPEATDHDRQSIQVRPQWVRLTYEPRGPKPNKDWYSKEPQCEDPNVSQHCHEYPFFASYQGGGSVTPTPRLKLIDGDQNVRQGRLYGVFTRQCLKSTDGAPFLSLPLPSGSGIPTLRLCNQ